MQESDTNHHWHPERTLWERWGLFLSTCCATFAVIAGLKLFGITVLH
jgi:hypothetical protein